MQYFADYINQKLQVTTNLAMSLGHRERVTSAAAEIVELFILIIMKFIIHFSLHHFACRNVTVFTERKQHVQFTAAVCC